MEQSIRAHTEPLPGSIDEVVAFLKRVLVLPNVQKVEVTSTQISVMRQVREGEPVVPVELLEDNVDVSALLKRLQPEQYPFDPEEHPYFCLEGACRTITNKKLFVTHILAPEGEWLSGWLGLSYVPSNRSRVLGMQVVYANHELLEGRIVLLGSTSSSCTLADVVHGIVVDINAS
jgi:hypothetical protein